MTTNNLCHTRLGYPLTPRSHLSLLDVLHRNRLLRAAAAHRAATHVYRGGAPPTRAFSDGLHFTKNGNKQLLECLRQGVDAALAA